MKIERFEDIEAWQPVESPSAVRLVDELKSRRSGPKGLQVERLARELTRKVYRLTKKPGFARDFERGRPTVNHEP